jgi:hypothetical protein
MLEIKAFIKWVSFTTTKTEKKKNKFEKYFYKIKKMKKLKKKSGALHGGRHHGGFYLMATLPSHQICLTTTMPLHFFKKYFYCFISYTCYQRPYKIHHKKLYINNLLPQKK